MQEDTPVSIPTMTSPQYEKKVLASLAASFDRIEIQKLRQGDPLTPLDVSELEHTMIGLWGTEGDQLLFGLLARNQSPSLAHFIRSHVGIERKAVQKHFASFLSEHALNPTQIRFIELIIDHLCKTGILAAETLYEQPFQALDSRGPESIFTDGKTLQGIFDRLRKIDALTG